MKNRSLAYPCSVSGKNVQFFYEVGGWTKGRPWIQDLTQTEEEIQTGIPTEPRQISKQILQRLAVLKTTPKGRELDHLVISPRTAVELFIEGKITPANLRQVVVGNDYLYLPTKLGKVVIQQECPFDFAPSNIVNTLIPCPA